MVYTTQSPNFAKVPFKRNKFWWSYEKGSTRHWNAFGIADSIEISKPKGHSITCEINPPFRAANRQPAGRFLKDENDQYYIAHTGRFNISGHRLKLDDYESWPRTHVCGTNQTVFVVSRLDDKRLINNLGKFVRTVRNAKDAFKNENAPKN